MHLDQLLGQWIDSLASVFQQAIYWFWRRNFQEDRSQLKELLEKGWEHAFTGLHLIAVCLAFLSDVLKPLSRRATKGLAYSGAAFTAGSFAGIQFDIVSQEIGAVVFVFSLILSTQREKRERITVP